MGIPGGANLLLAAGGDAPAYEIDQSLRFDGSSYLSKTFSSSGNRETNTLSLWCKRSYLAAFGDNNFTLVTADPNNNYDEIGFTQNYGNTESDEVWYRIQGGYYVIPNGLFRDVSAWTHLVFRRDGTQSTAANRLRIYINGAEATYRATNYQPQNQVWGKLCHSCNHRIGTYDNTYQKFKGYMAELHLVDGQSLGPDSFGEYDDNGVWRPIAYEGTYGTNGIYMKFDPSASNGIGHDHSGNGHHFTATGFTTSGTGTDVMSDTPTNNHATILPLYTNYTSNLYEANLELGPASDNGWSRCVASQVHNSGKWYFEVEGNNSLVNYMYKNLIGIAIDPAFISSGGASWGSSSVHVSYGAFLRSDILQATSNSVNGGSISGTFSQGAAMQCAVDIDAGKVWFGINDSYIGGGSPASGTSPTYTFTANSNVYFGASTYGSGSRSRMNFGQRAFVGTKPSGFNEINTSNISTPDIADGSKHFNTVIYTGNASSRSISGVGFQPAWVWVKTRNTSRDHFVYDVVRGSTNGNFYELRPSSTSAEGVPSSASTGLTSLDSDGFSVGSDASVNQNNDTYVAWSWKGGGSGSSNTSGSITSTVSANTTAGFSIVSYASGASGDKTVGHGLGVAPDVIITKSRDGSTYSWSVFHSAVCDTSRKYLALNNSNALTNYPNNIWGSSLPTSTVFGITSGNGVEANDDCIAYCFAEVEGYSKFGSYTGNGNNDGPFVYLGFRPALVLTKRTNSTSNWVIQDSTRQTYNPSDAWLRANTSGAEGTTNPDLDLDFLSNGFKVRNNGTDNNISGSTYIYAAFAENPFGGSGVSPATAR